MSVGKLTYYAKLLGEGFLNSYGQIYFSNGKILAALLVMVTFFDFSAGLSGALAVLVTQIAALSFRYDHQQLRDGTYSYNATMVGLALGIFYEFNFSLLIIISVSSLLTFFISIWFMKHLATKGLPFLSLPFLIVVWLILLGGQNFSSLELLAKTEFSLAAAYPELFSQATLLVEKLPFYNLFLMYFRSLGAILFQYNDLAGIIISIGILIHSRMSFVLSLYGFALGFFFYSFMEADFSQLIYSYIGFNFILTSLALGGFFVVASRRSFFLLALVIPMIALIINGSHGLFALLGLPLYSLPFNLIVLLVLFVLYNRSYPGKLQVVTIQHFSAEVNHYKYFNNVQRFRNQSIINISLPIIGFWRVSQGYNGGITHLAEYGQALDFDVIGDDGKTFTGAGDEKQQFHCYNLPVVAPAAGWVAAVVDGIEDNEIGGVNIDKNWGNTVVIRHSDYLYTKLSHLKKGSIDVKINDYVEKGQTLGRCGSSGRSPEPHLHFQVQTTPYIGSRSVFYPIDYFLSNENDRFALHSYDIPAEGSIVSNVNPTPILARAFKFIPGQVFDWEVKEDAKVMNVKWEVFVTAQNQPYIYCHSSKAVAYFVYSGSTFYFTDFYGKTNSLLHRFFKASHRILLGYYKGVTLKDHLLIADIFPKSLSFLHDFTAPLFHYLKSDYTFRLTHTDNEHAAKSVQFETECIGKLGRREVIHEKYLVSIEQDNGIRIQFSSKEKSFSAEACIN